MIISQIKKNIDLDQDLLAITESYTEIASIKMRRIRSGIEKNRAYFEEIDLLYQRVKQISRDKKVALTPKPRSSLAILITSNYHFYGSIERPVINNFLESKAQDKLAIGEAGIQYINNPQIPHITLKKDIPTPIELNQIRDIFKDYTQVIVYFSKMISPFKHQPQAFDVTETVPSNKTQPKIDYILEPELKPLVEFFDTQIARALLFQSFLEAELSRTAGRLIAMDQASEKSQNTIKEDRKKLADADRGIQDKKLLDMLASVKGHLHHAS